MTQEQEILDVSHLGEVIVPYPDYVTIRGFGYFNGIDKEVRVRKSTTTEVEVFFGEYGQTKLFKLANGKDSAKAKGWNLTSGWKLDVSTVSQEIIERSTKKNRKSSSRRNRRTVRSADGTKRKTSASLKTVVVKLTIGKRSVTQSFTESRKARAYVRKNGFKTPELQKIEVGEGIQEWVGKR